MIYYNPLDKFYKSIIGAVPSDTVIRFRVKGNFDSCLFVCHEDGASTDIVYKLEKKGDYFEGEISFSKVGLYFYRFKVNDTWLSQDEDFLGELTNNPRDFQLTVFDKNFVSPKWLNGGIIYQIFPDRFYCSTDDKPIDKERVYHYNKDDKPNFRPNEKGEVLNNDFFGGDLKGITEKLPYLKSLNVSVIYLNPIFKSFSNHRYDTGNYMEIDSMLGTKEDFLLLIESAKKLGIKIILDGVFNHTGSNSLYFNLDGKYDSNGAYQSKDSPYYNWYKFTLYPSKYDSWWGIKTLPALNKENEDYINFITGENGVIDTYTKMGIDGWRLDVVDELPENFSTKITSAIKKVNKDAVVIGEVWEDASNKIAYSKRRKYFLGKELDSVMNYPLKDAIIDFVLSGDSVAFSRTVKTLLDHYPKSVLDNLMNILSTHDTARIISALSNVSFANLKKEEKAQIVLTFEQYEFSKIRLKTASLLQFTLFGVPSIYYGDEVGMQGFFDPFNRCYFPWGKEDNELLSWYKKLGEIRSKYSAFSDGEFKEQYNQNGIYAFTRKDLESEVFIAVNCGKNTASIEFSGSLTDLLTEKKYNQKIDIKPFSQYLLVKNVDNIKK